MQGLTDHLLGLFTRVSAGHLCQIKKCKFFWHNFSPKNLVFKLVINFDKFVHPIFLNCYPCSHVCSQCHQSISAAFSEWLPKQWCMLWKYWCANKIDKHGYFHPTSPPPRPYPLLSKSMIFFHLREYFLTEVDIEIWSYLVRLTKNS